MSIRTVKVTNISPRATLRDMMEFFSYSGDIEHIELETGSEMHKMAYITFKNAQGAETAQLFTGSLIIDQHVEISFAENYKLPPTMASKPRDDDAKLGSGAAASAVKKAEDAVSAMIAKGFILGKDVIAKAKAFDEKHQLTATATARVTSLDRKISEKVSAGASTVGVKVREADDRYHVSEKTKSAYETTREKLGNAGSVLLGNRFVSAGMSWVYGAIGRMTRRQAPLLFEADQETDVDGGRRELEEELGRMHIDEAVSRPQQEEAARDVQPPSGSPTAAGPVGEIRVAQG